MVMNNKRRKIVFLVIILLSFSLRIYGLNWDQGYHLHPDERFLTMVGTTIRWPSTISQYFNTEKSPLNPYNHGYDFFVYGPFPTFLTKLVALPFGLDKYDGFNLVGRFLSAISDTGVVVLLYILTNNLWVAFLYSLMVLPIQLSHFFTVDTFSNFFIFLTFFSLLKFPIVLVGIFFGLALSCKISAVYFAPVIFLLLLKRYKRNLCRLLFTACCLFFVLLATFRFFSPYSFTGLFKINSQFVGNLKTLKSFDNPDAWFPPAVQWIKTKPLIFPAVNLFFWGLGMPMGIISVIAVLPYCYITMKRILLGRFFRVITRSDDKTILLVSLFWIFFLFFYQGVQFVKTMRYFLPIYPFLALVIGFFLARYLAKKPKSVIILVAFALLIYPILFTSIYLRSHSRVTASKWIYENIPSGSILSCEYWDDCLPLPMETYRQQYQLEMLSIYDQETEKKWQEINGQLSKVDYLILSSNRLWGSISKVPEKYPVASKFYKDLFAGELSFEMIKKFSSYPGFIVNDSWSEEAFTVYDHPEVMIFKKRR